MVINNKRVAHVFFSAPVRFILNRFTYIVDCFFFLLLLFWNVLWISGSLVTMLPSSSADIVFLRFVSFHVAHSRQVRANLVVNNYQPWSAFTFTYLLSAWTSLVSSSQWPCEHDSSQMYFAYKFLKGALSDIMHIRIHVENLKCWQTFEWNTNCEQRLPQHLVSTEGKWHSHNV